MPKATVYDVQGQAVGEMDLSNTVFGCPVRGDLLHRSVVAYLANQRQGTASTKTRGEVRGGGRKPWRQKGTGRARHGSIRSPLWRKGGVIFGPKPRDYEQRLPGQVRRAALRSALSAKLEAGQLKIVNQLELDEPKTKKVLRMLNDVAGTANALIVTDKVDPILYKSARNIPSASVMPAKDINAYRVLKHDCVVITQDAVKALEEALG